MRTPLRLSGMAIALVVISSLLTGCGPRTFGFVGLTVDQAGNVIAYANTCRDKHYWTEASINVPEEQPDPNKPRNFTDLVSWRTPTYRGALISWNLGQVPGPTWKTGDGALDLANLNQGVLYTVTVKEGGKNDQYALARVSFTADSIKLLKPGIAHLRDVKNNVTVPLEELTTGEICGKTIDTKPSASPSR